MGERIETARDRKGLNQKQASELCNVSRSTWSLYEDNHRVPSTQVLRIIAEKLGVTSDYLLGLKKNEK